MHLVDLIKILVPIAFALANLETIELGAGGLIVLEPLHQVFWSVIQRTSAFMYLSSPLSSR